MENYILPDVDTRDFERKFLSLFLHWSNITHEGLSENKSETFTVYGGLFIFTSKRNT
jgi:hypothetical protein